MRTAARVHPLPGVPVGRTGADGATITLTAAPGTPVYAIEAGRVRRPANPSEPVVLTSDNGYTYDYYGCAPAPWIMDGHVVEAGTVLGALDSMPDAAPPLPEPDLVRPRPEAASDLVLEMPEAASDLVLGMPEVASDLVLGMPEVASDLVLGMPRPVSEPGFQVLRLHVHHRDGEPVEVAALLAGLPDPGELGQAPVDGGLDVDPDALDRAIAASATRPPWEDSP